MHTNIREYNNNLDFLHMIYKDDDYAVIAR